MLNSTCLGWSLTLHYLLFLSEPTVLVGSDFFVLIFSFHFGVGLQVTYCKGFTIPRPIKKVRFTRFGIVPCHGLIIPQF